MNLTTAAERGFDVTKVAELASSTFWFVLPSLVLFVILPVLLKRQVGFALAMTIACLATMTCYAVTALILARLTKP